MNAVPPRARPLRVLQSFREPKSTTNPYLTMLAGGLRRHPSIEFEPFSARSALFASYDVFHIHWPEVLVEGHRLSGRIARRFLTALLLTRLTAKGTPVVRTVHNVERPSDLGWIENRLLDWFDRQTVLQIHLNKRTADYTGGRHVVIPHGDYRGWFSAYRMAPVETGRLQYVGLVRRYKGVEDLITSFKRVSDGSLRLDIVGKPSTPELAAELHSLASSDPRISTSWRFLDDAELARTVTSAELVVLPYRFMHNSGAALTALSLDRPILVPDTPVNRDLAEEVGAGWVFLYPGDLTSADIERAVDSRRTGKFGTRPNLQGRDWESVCAAHIQAYRLASGLGRREARSRRLRQPR